jgi:TonB-linked SusC/RagA family outer membrane protein
MNGMRQSQRGFVNRLHMLSVVGMSLLAALVLCAPAAGQQGQSINVTGQVTGPDGKAIHGVTVRVRGSTTTATTDQDGKYSIEAPSDGVLLFTLIGFRAAGQSIGGRTTLNVVMDRVITQLPEVVVTGYVAQRRADITGAAATVDVPSTLRQTTSSVLMRMDGHVPGVTVEAGGSPASRTTIRIRGVGSFQNNDPLYIVDGTPLQDTYLNWLNPDEIESVEVLKDASAASIYGSRASNGVILIQTKRGGTGVARRVTLDVRTGVASPVKGYDSFLMLNSLDYAKYTRLEYENAGLPVPTNIYGDPNNPTVPLYTYADPSTITSVDAWGRPATINEAGYSYPNALIMPGSAGTNWWKAVFSPAQQRAANLSVAGGGADNAYLVSFNYLNQEGTAAFTRYQRGGVRVNTDFTLDRVRVGENISVSREYNQGNVDYNNVAEGGILGKNIVSQPVIPIYDIAGNYAGGKATTLGNNNNPLRDAWAAKDNVGTNDRVFGNVFATLDASHGATLTTRFGFNIGQNLGHGYSPINPAVAEPTFNTSIYENEYSFTQWTWSNTLNYVRSMDRHRLTLLLGQEASKNSDRGASAGCASLVAPDLLSSRYIQDALCSSKNVSSSGTASALLSFFGKVDYNFDDRYYLNATVRRDGSSNFALGDQWGTFPAIGAGWRLSRESFLANNSFITNLMLRFGWGKTGNQQIPAGRVVAQFGGDQGATFYDITGSNTSVQTGYRQIALGNPNMKWEKNRSINGGMDLSFLDGRGSFTLDVYQRNTNDLLFDPRLPGTAGTAAPAIANVGKMKNTGFDFSIGYQGSLGAGTAWSASFNGGHNKNQIVEIASGQTCFLGPASLRQQDAVNNCVGDPIGAFFGLVADGYYNSDAEAAPFASSGAKVGRIRFKDLNGDGQITNADRTIIGSPHPKFSGGLDLGLRHGNWDLSATVFGTFGNQIFNAQKYWYVFGYFFTNVRKDRLTDSWTPTHTNAKYPRIDQSDVYSRQFSSYWVESGSYVRLRSLQVGYNLPPAFVRWIPAARVYVQAENLFTITGYSGNDPALPPPVVSGAAGDIRDQYRGVDQGTYPSNRTITIGITTTF